MSEHLTPEALAAARAICDAATPGPWWAEGNGIRNIVALNDRGQSFLVAGYPAENDREFIALARTLLPLVIRALERERARLDFLLAPQSNGTTRACWNVSGLYCEDLDYDVWRTREQIDTMRAVTP